jgi:hypothetical protein
MTDPERIYELKMAFLLGNISGLVIAALIVGAVALAQIGTCLKHIDEILKKY